MNKLQQGDIIVDHDDWFRVFSSDCHAGPDEIGSIINEPIIDHCIGPGQRHRNGRTHHLGQWNGCLVQIPVFKAEF